MDYDQGFWQALGAMRLAMAVACRHRAHWVFTHCAPFPGRQDSPQAYLRNNAVARQAWVIMKSETELGIL